MTSFEALLPSLPKTSTPDGPVLDFKIERATLDKALSEVSSVVPSSNLVPVLRNFHVRVSAGMMVTGSDAVISVSRLAPVSSVKVPGEAVFPASRLVTIVREAPGDLHVRVVSKKERLSAEIKSGNTSWTIPLMSPKGFPDFAQHWGFGLVEVEREPFLRALQRVRRAVSRDPMQPYLMLVDLSKGRMRASDSIRFQQVKYKFPFDCQIPLRAVSEVVSRLTSSNLENVEVGQTENALLFRFGYTLLIAQKVVAKFPDVDEVLLKPTLSNDQEFRVDRRALLKAVRRVRVTADEDTSAVVLSLNHGWVSVEAKDRRGGTAVESVEADWAYPPRHISFNHQHLADLLASTTSEVCVFRLGKELKTRPTPLLMEDEDFTAVLTQIRMDF